MSSAVPVASEASARFLFFTNECVGLGHLRRVLALSRAVTDSDPASSALIVTGSPLTPSQELPERVDTIKLPQLARDEAGQHRAGSLAIKLDHVQSVRAQLAVAAAESFAPDVAVVDKTPLGLGGELVPALDALKARSTRLVLGLRDIEDSPERVRASWQNAGMREAIERYYDAVFVYGPRSGMDALQCMGWRDLAVPVHHVGYVGSASSASGPADLPPRYVLATAGGGVDGFPLLSCALEAARAEPLPLPLVVVAGPLLPADELERLRSLASGIPAQVFDFRPDMKEVVAGAAALVTMAGYNTILELLGAGKAALVVPRVRPSAEQLTRAELLAATGRVDMLHPDTLTTSTLRQALTRLLDPLRPLHAPAAHLGASRAAEILAQLAASDTPARTVRTRASRAAYA